MLAVQVGHHRQHRRQLQERAIAFIRLSHQILRAAQPRVRPQRIHAPAHHHRKIQIAFAATRAQHRRDHRGRRRLAMHPGHGDPVLQPHQLGQHLRPLDHRNLSRPRLQYLGIGRRHRRAGYHHIACRRVAGRMSLVDRRSHARQTVCHRRPAQVRTRHRVAHGQQNLRDSAHANPADADEVDTVRRSEQKMARQKHGKRSLLTVLSAVLSGALALVLRRTRTSLYQPIPTAPPPAAQLTAPSPRMARILPFPPPAAGHLRQGPPPPALRFASQALFCPSRFPTSHRRHRRGLDSGTAGSPGAWSVQHNSLNGSGAAYLRLPSEPLTPVTSQIESEITSPCEQNPRATPLASRNQLAYLVSNSPGVHGSRPEQDTGRDSNGHGSSQSAQPAV